MAHPRSRLDQLSMDASMINHTAARLFRNIQAAQLTKDDVELGRLDTLLHLMHDLSEKIEGEIDEEIDRRIGEGVKWMPIDKVGGKLAVHVEAPR